MYLPCAGLYLKFEANWKWSIYHEIYHMNCQVEAISLICICFNEKLVGLQRDYLLLWKLKF